MEYTIEKLKTPIHVEGIPIFGYAFLDKNRRCIIITYGESKRDLFKKILK